MLEIFHAMKQRFLRKRIRARHIFVYYFIRNLDLLNRYFDIINRYLKILRRKFDIQDKSRKFELLKSRKENPQKPTQLSSRSHPRHLVGKRTAQKTPS